MRKIDGDWVSRLHIYEKAIRKSNIDKLMRGRVRKRILE